MTTETLKNEMVLAHSQIKEMITKLDKFELDYYFTSAHKHDVETNESQAFSLLQKTLTAFRELEAKI